MWADSKIIGFLKFGSMAQKLLNVEKFRFLHFSCELKATFEPMNQI